MRAARLETFLSPIQTGSALSVPRPPFGRVSMFRTVGISVLCGRPLGFKSFDENSDGRVDWHPPTLPPSYPTSLLLSCVRPIDAAL